MKREKRNHPSEFKAKIAIEAIKGKFSVSELSEKYGVHPSLIHAWKKTVVESAPVLMEKNGKSGTDDVEARISREIERLNQENEWLQRFIMKLNPSERKAAVELNNPKIPLLRQVRILNINRSSLYYKRKTADGENREERIAN